MSAIANIAVLDGESTPVTHTFYPIQSGPDSFWRESIAALSLIGQSTIKLTFRQDPRSGLFRQTWVLETPALETAGSQNAAGYTAGPKVAYSSKYKVDVIHHNRSSTQFRKNARVMASNLLLNAIMLDANDNLNTPY
jgi:hypothetical protein